MFVERLVGLWHCSKHQEYSSEQDKQKYLSLYSLLSRGEEKKMDNIKK